MATRPSPKHAAIGAAGTFGLLAFLRRRRRRLHNAAEEIHDTVLPPGYNEPVTDLTDPHGVGHAPGHQHLPPPPEVHSTGAEAARRPRVFRPYRG
jgi:hypothetical protein